MLDDLALDLLGGFLYGALGIVLMVAGYVLIDVLTPGRLGHLMMVERRRDVGVVVACAMLAVAAIVPSAILARDGDLGVGLAEAAGFGVVGIVLLGLAFTAVDRMTPGRLGHILTDEHEDPAAAYVAGASLIGVGAIIAAAIS